MEYRDIKRSHYREGGRIDRRTAIRRPSQSRHPSPPIIPTFPNSKIPVDSYGFNGLSESMTKRPFSRTSTSSK
jgi:hypothetical protein